MSYTRIEKVEVDEKVYEKTLKYFGRKKTEFGIAFYSCKEIDERLRRTERALRTAFKKGVMRRDVFEALAKFINVNPDYLSGRLFKNVRALSLPEPVKEAIIASMTPDKYPYGVRNTKEASDMYLEDILALHGISPDQLKLLGKSRELDLALQIEYAVVPILCSFFNENAKGEDLYPAVWELSAQIENAKDELAMSSID